MDRRRFIKDGIMIAAAQGIALDASARHGTPGAHTQSEDNANPDAPGYDKPMKAASGHEQTKDLYLIWDDGDGPEDLRIRICHSHGSCVYSFNQNHTPGRHFAGTYVPGTEPAIEEYAGIDADVRSLPFKVEWKPTPRRALKIKARDTMTPLTLNIGDSVEYTLRDGTVHKIKCRSGSAEVTRLGPDDVDGVTTRVTQYRFEATFDIDGKPVTLSRLNAKESSFFEDPFIIGGMMIHLDAVKCIFEDDGGFMGEKDSDGGITCRPKRDVRIVIHDASLPICPGKIAPWFPGAERRHKNRICYHGRDTWMGPWSEGGSLAHGGLDINMPDGTILSCPIDVDDQYFFQSIANGDVNNRWRGVRKFEDGTVWWIQAHHINFLLPDIIQHAPLVSGTAYADTAGTFIGRYEHTHFCFRVFEGEEDFWLDPWILMRAVSKL